MLRIGIYPIFDDFFSFIHLVIGFIAGIFHLWILWDIFIFYQVLEWLYKKDCFWCDCIEFIVGYGFAALSIDIFSVLL